MKFKTHLMLFVRSFFLQTGWNAMKFQNLGLTFVMWPYLKKLYAGDSEALPSVMTRYLETFNTQPVMASFCIGALARQEERIAQAKNLTELNERAASWSSVKRSLSITTASIGDRLFWGTLKPLTLLMALFIWTAVDVNLFDLSIPVRLPITRILSACGAAFLVFNTIALFVKWRGISIGYNAHGNTCFGLIEFDWNKTIYHAKQLGLLLTVAMILLGVYVFLKEYQTAINVHFLTRAVIVVFFVCISFITRRLRIPNMYLYLASVAVFNIVCYL